MMSFVDGTRGTPKLWSSCLLGLLTPADSKSRWAVRVQKERNRRHSVLPHAIWSLAPCWAARHFLPHPGPHSKH